jgi:hypothetical protein
LSKLNIFTRKGTQREDGIPALKSNSISTRLVSCFIISYMHCLACFHTDLICHTENKVMFELLDWEGDC